MSYDGILLHQSVKSMQNLVTGRISKIYQVSNYELLFIIRANKENHKLLFSCHPMYARMQCTNLAYPTPEQPNTLTMLFRKHLDGGFIEKIEQIENDRICKLSIKSFNELGDLATYYMYIEIMAKHSNITLCTHEHKIIDCLKRISPSMNSSRFLQPGATYNLPPMDDTKVNPYTSNYIESDNYTSIYQGMSPLLSKELLYRINSGQKYNDIIKEIEQSNKLYCSTLNNKNYFHIIPLLQLQTDVIEYDLFEGLDFYFQDIDTTERIKQQTANLVRYVQNEYQKNCLKLKKLQETLDSSTNRDIYRIKGDLLFSNLHLFKTGDHKVEVINYYDNTSMIIDLDIKLDPKTNAKKYYHKYQKAKNAIVHLNEQIINTNEEITYFDGLISLLSNANFEDALEIKDELIQLGYLKNKQKYTKKKNTPKYHTYYMEDGTEILVGKNNIQNDHITFKIASRYDTWFHVKDMPGSHVIVKSKDLSEETIRTACNLACNFSKAKNSSSVPVNYTLIKNIKKIPGGKPGQVIIDQYKTLYIDPDHSYKELRKK